MRAPFVKLWTRLIRKFSLAESSQNQLPADEEVNAQDVVDRRGVYGVLLCIDNNERSGSQYSMPEYRESGMSQRNRILENLPIFAKYLKKATEPGLS
ncbi:hypothetical protein I7I51_08275 [Histoplasma capsulatum]|uniref:Uncharacterized protein n=2 Tax=Histoplasma TaxID=5036 RepID=A0A8A1LXF3_AJECA|nr:hypothetical protein I7I51_08275 [Histoplasma capsulatum]